MALEAGDHLLSRQAALEDDELPAAHFRGGRDPDRAQLEPGRAGRGLGRLIRTPGVQPRAVRHRSIRRATRPQRQPLTPAAEDRHRRLLCRGEGRRRCEGKDLRAIRGGEETPLNQLLLDPHHLGRPLPVRDPDFAPHQHGEPTGVDLRLRPDRAGLQLEDRKIRVQGHGFTLGQGDVTR